jgi:hypothetical protein
MDFVAFGPERLPEIMHLQVLSGNAQRNEDGMSKR